MALYATALRPTYNERSQYKIETFPQGLVKNFLVVLLVIAVLLSTKNSLFYEPNFEQKIQSRASWRKVPRFSGIGSYGAVIRRI